MKIIDKHNVEEWLFDYFEGNLNESSKSTLISYLNQHPELQADYDAWKNSYVRSSDIIYPRMEDLLKKDNTGKKWITRGLSSLLLLGIIVIPLYYGYFTEGTSSTETNTPASSTFQVPENKKSGATRINLFNEKEENKIPVTSPTEKLPIVKVKSSVFQNSADTAQENSFKIITPDPSYSNRNPFTKQDSIKEIQLDNEIVTNKPANDSIHKPSDVIPKKGKVKKVKNGTEMKIVKLKGLGF